MILKVLNDAHKGLVAPRREPNQRSGEVPSDLPRFLYSFQRNHKGQKALLNRTDLLQSDRHVLLLRELVKPFLGGI